MKKIAVIGMAHPHIFSMIEEVLASQGCFTVTALCDEHFPEAIEQAKKMLPNVSAFSSVDVALQQGDFDVVMSSDIFGNKGKLAFQCLAAHKDLLFDKPLSTTQEDIHQIESLIAQNPDNHIALWLTERYSPTYYTAKQLIDADAIGQIVHMSFVRPHRLAPQTRPYWMFDSKLYGGILNDIGVHDVDLSRWFTHSECKTIISSETRSCRYKDIEDIGTAYYIMESGATCMICENWLTPDQFPAHGDTRAFIYGTKGQIEIKSYPEEVVIFSDDKTPQTVSLLSPPQNSVKDFYDVLIKRSFQPLVTTQDALKSTQLALNIQKNAQLSK